MVFFRGGGMFLGGGIFKIFFHSIISDADITFNIKSVECDIK